MIRRHSRRLVRYDWSDFGRQHGSHRQLLQQFGRDEVGVDNVDAIVVPTSRPVENLDKVIDIAKSVKSALLVLCSKESVPSAAASMAEQANVAQAGVEFIAVDIAGVDANPLRTLSSDKMIAEKDFGGQGDLSFKRNLGIYFSILADWQRIVFLDDDITVPAPKDLGLASALLDRFCTVGLKVEGFPDNSVVCHANRQVGRFQETYIGGGALAVNVKTVNSFFPNIYNEDWLFLLGRRRPQPSAVVGEVQQAPYDPFRSPERAAMEEFGDCIAEGLYALLDLGFSVTDATVDYWRRFLKYRLSLIATIRESVSRSDRTGPEKDRMRDALDAAYKRCNSIEPELCVRYLDAWWTDRRRWSRFLSKVRRRAAAGGGPMAAARELGIERLWTPNGDVSVPSRLG